MSAYNLQQNSCTECDEYNPDSVFKRFNLIEFPTSFVGLWTVKTLDVEFDLTVCAYLKTMCDGQLMKFKDARERSAAHRAFEISYVDSHTIEIKFNPKNESISKVKHNKNIDNRLVFDLRLIQVNGTRCCNNEFHSEIGRYYICGGFEYCNISHYPGTIDFGHVVMNSKTIRHVRVNNESHIISVKMKYVKAPGFEVTPQEFMIPPNSSRRLTVCIKPHSLILGNQINFQVRNPHDNFDEGTKVDKNFLTYSINLQSNVTYHKIRKNKITEVESLHKLYEPEPKYTYLNDELTLHKDRMKKAYKYLENSKTIHESNPIADNFSIKKVELCMPMTLKKADNSFCKHKSQRVSTYDLLDISLLPYIIDFGKVGLRTYGEKELLLKNRSKYDIQIKLLKDNSILYTEEKVDNLTLTLRSFADITVTIFFWGDIEGKFRGIFSYTIDNKYQRKHPYKLQVCNPNLTILDRSLKFGMVTTEAFITSVPLRIYNTFNVSIDFKWNELHSDIPFDIIPHSGTVEKRSCKICDVIYISKPSKAKTYEVDLITENTTQKNITLELCVITRKLSIKFLQSAVTFKDIGLNIKTVETVKLENSSREIAYFYVVEPLIPGLNIEPMSGTIRPKMVITFEIIVKIPCVVEFSFDIHIKVNNKENVILPVSGNVVEPKLLIHPKFIYMSRIPCGMITYVPVTFQNMSSVKSFIEVLDTGDDNIFDVYIAQGNEKQRVFQFDIEGNQNKTVFIKVYDIFRREYEMYIPFKINGLLGPPDFNTWSTELQHYIGDYEQCYKNNPKVKLKIVNKDICFCRMTGVITVPWIQFSTEKFEIDYVPNAENIIEFTMTNVSKYYLYITILTTKLVPNFTLDLNTDENQTIINGVYIKFELDRQKQASLTLKFHPKSHGKFVSTAILYLDKHLALPYYNLTFVGKRQSPLMSTNIHRVVFPPAYVGTAVTRKITLRYEDQSDINSFTCVSKEETNLSIQFTDFEVLQEFGEWYSIITIEVTVECQVAYYRHLTLIFNHTSGSTCEVDVNFCFTYCPITLHCSNFVNPQDNPYPYFPMPEQTKLYEYLNNCSNFLEKWMFKQGFRRDLYPVIPDTFHAISAAVASQTSATKTKGINVSYLNFVRRVAGPLMKHIRKKVFHGIEEPFKTVKEIHDTYQEIINLLRSRGANVWILKASFLLSYEQFTIYTENVTPTCNTDIILNKELIMDVNLFHRLNKQSWVDFILQSYKVFIMDSCFFDCVCLSSEPRDIVKVLVDWFNEQITVKHNQLLGKNKPLILITDLRTDLCDGRAIASAISNYCTFLNDHFSIFCDVNDRERLGGIIHNACLNIEAMNILKLFFPIHSTDFLEPNYLQMLFLSIHLYVSLPMFKTRDIIRFNPPLLRSSTRQITISPASQEALIFNHLILNNLKNNFFIEKAQAGDNGKKMFLSVKYVANFTTEQTCLLLVHGYNKTRIFDTYMVFILKGSIGSLNPVRKCKVTGPLYRPNRTDILVSSPFGSAATYRIYIKDKEPVIPVNFHEENKPKFFLRRLNLIDKEINLSGLPKESGQVVQEHKLYFQMNCLSTQIENTWIWFRSEIGEFFIRVSLQPRWDLAIDTLQARVRSWPLDPCSCGEACECYRTTILVIPHKNDLMLKALRYALLEHASEVMMQVYDQLIDTPTGKMILGMLLEEGGTNMSDVHHILRSETNYRITSRALLPGLKRVKFLQHSSAMLPLPITLPTHDKAEKYTVTFTSDCGMDVRTYRVFFIESPDGP